ncbi:MAG: hypothetical protein MI922_04295 [Bacteroidales bacterium]|nr:hypothetical protein [Bacteroidales bacterium]
MGEKLYDLAFLNKISDGDSAFIMEMVTSFIESAEEYMQKADNQLSNNNYDAFGKATHKFIPGVSFLGIKSIEHDLMVLEDNCKKGVNLEGIASDYEKLKNKIVELMTVFKADFNLV